MAVLTHPSSLPFLRLMGCLTHQQAALLATLCYDHAARLVRDDPAATTARTFRDAFTAGQHMVWLGSEGSLSAPRMEMPPPIAGLLQHAGCAYIWKNRTKGTTAVPGIDQALLVRPGQPDAVLLLHAGTPLAPQAVVVDPQARAQFCADAAFFQSPSPFVVADTAHARLQAWAARAPQ